MTLLTCDHCSGYIEITKEGVFFESDPTCSKCARLCDDLHYLVNANIPCVKMLGWKTETEIVRDFREQQTKVANTILEAGRHPSDEVFDDELDELRRLAGAGGAGSQSMHTIFIF